MTNLNEQTEPQLEKPGAGLPLMERILLKYYFGPFVAAKNPFSWTEANFQKLHERILLLAESIEPADFETKCLVPRLQGIEDSSRYWSAKMTLEHILIVGTNLREIIIQLSNHANLDLIVDIAKVKPTGQQNREQILSEFRKYCSETIPYLKKNMGDYESPSKLYHPWFGPMSTKMWAWLLVGHGSLHLKQLKEIIKVLEQKKKAASK